MATAKKPTETNNAVLATEEVAIKSLKQHPKNPRIGNVDVVAESLAQYGQYRAIIANKRNKTIVAGHHTWLAARQLGWDTVQVSWINVDETTHRKIMLMDNKSSSIGGFDENLLAEIMASVPDATVGTGYSSTEVDELMEIAARAAQEASQSAEAQIEQGVAEYNEQERQKSFEGSDLGGEPTTPTIEGAPMDIKGPMMLKDPEFMDYAKEPGIAPWGIPELLPDKFMTWDDINPNLTSWAGSATKDWDVEDQQWWYNWAIDSTSGMKDVSNVIVGFYCVDEQTEALTKRGWVTGHDITEQDEVLSLDPITKEMKWSAIHDVFKREYKGQMYHLTSNGMDALVTPNHKFVVQSRNSDSWELTKVDDLRTTDTLILMGSEEQNGHSIYSDSFVEAVGWAVTEGHFSTYERKRDGGSTKYVTITQKIGSEGEPRIRHALKMSGALWNESISGNKCRAFKVKGSVAERIHAVAPNRVLTHEFIQQLSPYQRSLLIDTMIDGDGTRSETATVYHQKDKTHVDAFVYLCTLSGIATTVRERHTTAEESTFGIESDIYLVTLLKRSTAQMQTGVDFHGAMRDKRGGGGKDGTGNYNNQRNEPTVAYDGLVWCPKTDYGTFVVRRNDKVYVTGNTYDEYFEGWWDRAGVYCGKVLNSNIKYIASPNFSQWSDAPRAVNIHQLYRSHFLGRYFQEIGLKLCTDVLWPLGDMEFLETITLPTLPVGIPLISMEMQTTADDVAEYDHYKAEYQKVFDTLKPGGMILYAGKPGREWFEQNIITGCPVKYVPTRNEKLSVQANNRQKKTTI